jgi:hypothetical protein
MRWNIADATIRPPIPIMTYNNNRTKNGIHDET